MKRDLSPKHLKAISWYIRGYTQKESLSKAGLNINPHMFFSDPDVRKELEKRTDKILAKAELSKEWLVKKYMEIVDTGVGDLVEINADGDPYLDWDKLNKTHKQFLQNFQIDTYTEGRGPEAREVKRVKVQWPDKLAALNALMKIAGLDKTVVKVEAEEEAIDRYRKAAMRISSPEVIDGISEEIVEGEAVEITPEEDKELAE